MKHLHQNHLNVPLPLFSYSIGSSLRRTLPEKTVTEVGSWQFDFLDFADHEHCSAELETDFPHQCILSWHGKKHGAEFSGANACWRIKWHGKSFQVVRVSWKSNHCNESAHWIISDDQRTAIDFVTAVCEWNDRIQDVVYSFGEGRWRKDRDLYQAIQSADFDSLILDKNLKQEVIDDFEHFLDSRERYHCYNVPWKRGVIFTGPPGNGKTHFIKALVSHLGIPCYYVKSFETQDGFDSTGISRVYETARRSTPCILVLEDLDSLVNEKNRTYFLNELDGFASNDGVITVATTNYPEKLDTAILERPSRFDRKWQFELPSKAARQRYLSTWNTKLPIGDQLTTAQLEHIAETTPNFSFAYLKELCLGALLQWVRREGSAELASTIHEHRENLIAQSQQLSQSS